MKIAPLKQSDPWYGRIVNDAQVHSDALTGVPIESTVEMELVELMHGGPESNYRPYLHLRGELTEVRPAVELPYGISELALRRGSGLAVDAFYDFTQEQLSDLVSKGYFTAAFRVPDEMSGIPWTLPGKADFLVVAPELNDEPPLVFMNVHNQTGMEFDEANSGYELAAYFPDYSAEAEAGHEDVEQDAAEPERGGSVLDVFSDVELPEHDVVHALALEDVDAVRALVPDGVFSRLVSEIQAQQLTPEPEPDKETVDETTVPGSAWDVYMSRISPGVEHVLSGQHLVVEPNTAAGYQAEDADQDSPDISADHEPIDVESAPVSDVEDFVDVLGDDEPEPELTPLSLQGGGARDDDHLKIAKRRANQLRAEIAAESDDRLDGEAEPVI